MNWNLNLIEELDQIMTSKVDPRTERIKIFIMAVYLSRGFSNEEERTN